MNLKIYAGNIIDVTADAVVLPSNPKLREGSGVSEVLFYKAGKDNLTNECRKIIKERHSISYGTAVPTRAYNLGSKYILHAIVPKWKDGKHHEYEQLSSAYLSCLRLADYLECKCIVFPLLASGNNKFKKSVAFEIAVNNIKQFESQMLQEAIIILYGNSTVSYVKEQGYEVDQILPSNLVSIDPKEAEFIEHTNMLKKSVKDLTRNYIQDGVDYLKNAIDYINQPDTRDKIEKVAASIAKAAVESRM